MRFSLPLLTRRTVTVAQLLLAAVFLSCVAVTATTTITSAARLATVQTTLEPASDEAAGLYTALADADAAVAVDALTVPVDDPDTLVHHNAALARYRAAIGAASRALVVLASDTGEGAPGDRAAAVTRLSRIEEDFATYTGLVERARADDRVSLVIGSAYRDRASALMTERLLPDTGAQSADAAAAVDRELDDTFAGVPVLVLTGAAFLVALAVAAWVFLSHWELNLRLAAAAALGLVAVVVTVLLVNGYSDTLHEARRRADVTTERLTPALIAAYRARSVEALILVSRSGEATEPDFEAAATALRVGIGGGLAVLGDDPTAALVRDAGTHAEDFVRSHGAVAQRNETGPGTYEEAVALVTDPTRNGSVKNFQDLDESLRNAITTQRGLLHVALAGRPRDLWIDGGIVVVLLVAAACCALTALGAQKVGR